VTITLNSWAVPVVLTIALWVACHMWPTRPSYGYYDFGFDEMLHGLVAVFGTLVIWLIYFAVRFAIG
jgi:hypothetical protein